MSISQASEGKRETNAGATGASPSGDGSRVARDAGWTGVAVPGSDASRGTGSLAEAGAAPAMLVLSHRDVHLRGSQAAELRSAAAGVVGAADAGGTSHQRQQQQQSSLASRRLAFPQLLIQG